jgi:hypothetical protein
VASTGLATVASTGPESVIEVESSESEMGDDESLESDSEESTEETIEKKKANLAKLKASVNKHRGRLKAIREHITNKNASLAEDRCS